MSSKEIKPFVSLLQKNAEIKHLENQERHYVKKIIESLFFATSEPISFSKLKEILESQISIKPQMLKDALTELQQEYITQDKSFRLEEVASGFILKTCAEFAPFIEQLYRNKRQEKLSQAALEVLAIIAYKQPITKPQIEAIRGVDCSGTVQNLLERELIYSASKLEAPGRPSLFSTTDKFLLHFGIKNVSELPSIHN